MISKTSIHHDPTQDHDFVHKKNTKKTKYLRLFLANQHTVMTKNKDIKGKISF